MTYEQITTLLQQGFTPEQITALVQAQEAPAVPAVPVAPAAPAPQAAPAEALVSRLLEAKGVISFGQAAKLLGWAWMPSTITRVITAFENTRPGASALLVNRWGFHSLNPKTAPHAQWLRSHGYEEEGIPQRR